MYFVTAAQGRFQRIKMKPDINNKTSLQFNNPLMTRDYYVIHYIRYNPINDKFTEDK